MNKFLLSLVLGAMLVTPSQAGVVRLGAKTVKVTSVAAFKTAKFFTHLAWKVFY